MPRLSIAVRRACRAIKKRGNEAAGGAARLQIALLLGGVLGLDAADKAALSAVAGELQKAFHIGYFEIGLLISAVSFVGAVFALPFGTLVDRINRRHILLAAIALWTLAMLVSGTATSFVYLLVTRLFLGAVTATAAPSTASLVGDFFPAAARARIYGVILAGELVGTGVGFLLAGEVSAFSGWRWGLSLMALPSLAVLWAVWRYLPEPSRGGQNWIRLGQRDLTAAAENARADDRPQPGADTAARPRELVEQADIQPREDLILRDDPAGWNLWRAVRYLLRIPTYTLLIVASTLSYYFFSGARAFGMIYLTQHYHVSRGVVGGLAIVVGLGAIAGLFAGGRLSERLLDRGWIGARIIVPGAALLAAAALFWPAIWMTNVILATALLTGGTAALAAANPPIDAARLDVVPSGLWGRGESGRMALRGLLEGGAPIIFGAMSDWLGGGVAGLEWTFSIMLIPVVVAASLAIPARRSYPRDVATAQASARQPPAKVANETKRFGAA